MLRPPDRPCYQGMATSPRGFLGVSKQRSESPNLIQPSEPEGSALLALHDAG
jgi:hypothetical protein